MSSLVDVFDSYERRARIYPMLLVLLPAGLAAASWLPDGLDVIGLCGGALASVVLAAFLGQIARDQGKKREPELFKRWCGKPSVTALSYVAKVFDAATLGRIHGKLRDIDKDLRFPESEEEEAADREAAFAVYESASELLLSQTRDHSRFGLVFHENVNYGYRRNLWAMKPAGLILACLGVAASVGRLALGFVMDTPIAWTALAGALIGVALGSMWVMRVTESWVRVAAESFARQLCLAAQSIPTDGS